MIQTMQPYSCAYLSKEKKLLEVIKSETEENMSLLLQLFGNLNDFYETLNRLNYVIKIFINKGETK
jgi:hypothetical protein